jgi:cation diffusion facilitator CzcD-associated flavoprotein CzcO
VPRSHAEGHVHDVVIIGGGQSGLGAAFGLLRERISNLLILDENPAGFEGPWDTYARMATLRTPKHLGAIEQGVASLSFRAWWEAQHGGEDWEALGKIRGANGWRICAGTAACYGCRCATRRAWR